ncbi:MAG: helix-turn-helix domain-containing protein [Candidatus Neoclostridium sp.]
MLEMGGRIKQLRKQNNLTQSALANLMRTTQDTISLWELGKSYPDAESIVRMAKLFRTSSDFLLGLCDSDEKK